MSHHKKDETTLYEVFEHGLSKNYSIYLNQEIESPENYTQLLNLLRCASSYDIVNIYINSPGGNLSAGLQIITAMKESLALVRTFLDGMAMSLAPLILFAGDEVYINDNTMIMFHDFSTGSGGKGGELLSAAEAYTKFYKDLLISYAYPFLSMEEIDNITKGQDVYFNSKEIILRLNQMKKQLDKNGTPAKKRQTRKKKVDG